MYLSIIFVAQLMFVKSPGLLKQSFNEKCIVKANEMIADYTTQLRTNLGVAALRNDFLRIAEECKAGCLVLYASFEEQYMKKYPETTVEILRRIKKQCKLFFEKKPTQEWLLSQEKSSNEATNCSSLGSPDYSYNELWNALKESDIVEGGELILELLENVELNVLARVYCHFYKRECVLGLMYDNFRKLEEIPFNLQNAKNEPSLASFDFTESLKIIVELSRNLRQDFGCPPEEIQNTSGLPAEHEPDCDESRKKVKKDLNALLKHICPEVTLNGI